MDSQFEQILRDNLLKSDDKFMFFKGFGKDLQSQFPNGSWRTINGSKVFINNGKVVAGLNNFNGLIDDFFKEKEEKESEKDNNIYLSAKGSGTYKENNNPISIEKIASKLMYDLAGVKNPSPAMIQFVKNNKKFLEDKMIIYQHSGTTLSVSFKDNKDEDDFYDRFEEFESKK